jgi:predicted AlkP superfamily pyrophosphatase or phosphodiesterase
MIRPLFASVTLALGLISAAPAAAPLQPKDRHVILISLDGFPAWLWHDPSLPAPNLRKLAAEGATADAMTVSNPSITWINHTTLVTGVNPRRHGVLFNGLLVRHGNDKPPKIEQWVDKTELVHVPTLYDLGRAAGLTSAESDWVAVTRAKTIDWSFPELPKAEGPVERELAEAGILTPEQCEWFGGSGKGKNIAWRDSTWTKAAIFMFQKHRPNLLMMHLLNTDAIHHMNGPGSFASYTALAYADRLVGDVVQAAKDSGLRDSTTIFVTTDHGFKKVQKVIYPNVVLKKAGHLKALTTSITQCEVCAVAEGGLAFIYVTDPAKRAELLPSLKELFSKVEGVGQVLDGNEGPSLGMPTPAENQGMGDLILYAKAGYAFKDGVAGENDTGPSDNYVGTHGYINSDPELDGIFITSGAGIKKGVVIPRMANLDVAPTIAKLLGLTIDRPEGRVLSEVLE